MDSVFKVNEATHHSLIFNAHFVPENISIYMKVAKVLSREKKKFWTCRDTVLSLWQFSQLLFMRTERRSPMLLLSLCIFLKFWWTPVVWICVGLLLGICPSPASRSNFRPRATYCIKFRNIFQYSKRSWNRFSHSQHLGRRNYTHKLGRPRLQQKALSKNWLSKVYISGFEICRSRHFPPAPERWSISGIDWWYHGSLPLSPIGQGTSALAPEPPSNSF